jgi:hypothetical protein
MRVLDLFCCAGGAGVGYSRAGFEVIGVDISYQPDYPFQFIEADVLSLMAVRSWEGIDLVHASPPCQKDCTLTKGTNKARGFEYPDLYGPVRDLIYASGVPGVIENPAARPDWVLCGEMFDLGVIRHRKIELVNWTAQAPAHKPHRGRVRGWRHGVYYDGPYIAAYGDGGGKGSVAEMQSAMGIDWTDSREALTEAIPPAYTECVGRAFAAQLGSNHA